MGPALQNLDQLLDMPFGCGEQNMVKFAPNIFILQYLNKTKQLDPEIKAIALAYLIIGKHCPSSFCCKMKLLEIKSVGYRCDGELKGRSGSDRQSCDKGRHHREKGNVSWKEKFLKKAQLVSAGN